AAGRPGALQGRGARRAAVHAVRAAADLRADAEDRVPVQAPALHGAPDRRAAQPRLPVPGGAAADRPVRTRGRAARAGDGVQLDAGTAVPVDAAVPAADAEARLRPGLAADPAQVPGAGRLLLLPARLRGRRDHPRQPGVGLTAGGTP